MYLARNIRWRGEIADMVGAIPADVIVGNRPQGRGYMVVEDTRQHPWSLASDKRGDNSALPVHEFHYARLENLDDKPVFAHQVRRGTGIDGKHDGLVINNLLAGFAHHRNTDANPWVSRFVAFVRSNSVLKKP
jgi:cobyrinic acid a,c-diamide synthase